MALLVRASLASSRKYEVDSAYGDHAQRPDPGAFQAAWDRREGRREDRGPARRVLAGFLDPAQDKPWGADKPRAHNPAVRHGLRCRPAALPVLVLRPGSDPELHEPLRGVLVRDGQL